MKKSIITTVVLSALISLLSACASTPVTSFSGDPRDAKDIASLTFDQGAFLKLGLFKVDGKVSDSSNLLYNSGRSLDIDLQLLPGKHELEICLGRIHEVKILTYDFKAGSRYELLFDDKQLSLVENINGKQVPVVFQLRDLPEYKEPGEKEPHAIILEEGITNAFGAMFPGLADAAKGGIAVLYRIDGVRGNKWDFLNVKFGESGLSETFSVRLKPGIHTLELYFHIGNKYTKVQSVQFNFEAGKKYTPYLEELKNMKDLGLCKIVEVK
ncbi:MAG TPA: hypothetical protein PKG60_00230 [Spirochaetota bacterium]|nr:hypothetical protein [Spirochaetota bacterium]HPS87189.1 hypothetical protein [Spirochaetota bacterium]